MLEAEVKSKIITGLASKKGDTGSPQVQVGVLTERIRQLTAHLQTQKQDNHSRMGLLKMVNRRRKLLSYLNRQDPLSYQALIKKLDLRR